MAINAETLFEDDDLYNAIFDANRSANEFLVGYVLLRQVEEKVRKATQQAMALPEKDSKKERFHRLIRAKKLVNLHLVALMGHVIRDKYGGYNDDVATRLFPRIADGQFTNQMYDHLETILFDYMDAIEGVSEETSSKESLHSALRKPQALTNLIERLRKHFALPAYKSVIDEALLSTRSWPSQHWNSRRYLSHEH